MRQTIRRWLTGSAGLVVAALYAGACNTADLTETPPCRGDGCSCEADPTQARCRGLNDRPDGTVFPEEEFDAGDARAPADAGDAGDSSSDAADAAADG